MRDSLAETLVGAAVLAVAGFFLVYSLGTSGQARGGGYELSAEFAAIDGLAIGSDVRVSGVKVGSVSQIILNPNTFNAEVKFNVAPGVEVPIDSSVALKSDGLLGSVHLAIEPGGDAEVLEAGGAFDTPGQGSIDVFRLLQEFITNACR